jgi:threonine synthase
VASTNVNDTVLILAMEFTTLNHRKRRFQCDGCGELSNFIEFRKCTTTIWSTKRTFFLYLTDKETTEAMKTIYKVNYIVEPHGAVGYLGLKRITKFNALGIFLETSH